jgi:hypothetical protein
MPSSHDPVADSQAEQMQDEELLAGGNTDVVVRVGGRVRRRGVRPYRWWALRKLSAPARCTHFSRCGSLAG